MNVPSVFWIEIGRHAFPTLGTLPVADEDSTSAAHVPNTTKVALVNIDLFCIGSKTALLDPHTDHVEPAMQSFMRAHGTLSEYIEAVT